VPWKVFKTGPDNNPWCVYKVDTNGAQVGDSLGCHPSQDDANAQVRALYANETEEGENMPDLGEAKTLKAEVMALLRAADTLLARKKLPPDLRRSVAALRTALKDKKWTDLAADAEDNEEVGEATKTVGGKSYPSGDFLVVEDPGQPSTWHLQVKRNGKPDHNLMGAAWAALHGGYRGNKYEGPNKARAITKLKALYQAEDMEVPAESKEQGAEVPASYTTVTSFAALQASALAQQAMDTVMQLTAQFRVLAENILLGGLDEPVEALRVLADEYLALVEQTLEGLGAGPGEDVETEEAQAEPASLQEVQLGEMGGCGILGIVEDVEGNVSKAKPLVLDIAVIRPGWGNTADNHYYPAEMLKENARVFKGAKMYATNHREDQVSVLTEMSQVLDCPVRFLDDGTPVARVGVFDEGFAANIRNRDALKTLDSLHVSIKAGGTAEPEYEEGGRKGKKIVSINPDGARIDWVTQAGAGGHALEIVSECATGEGGDMPEDTIITDEGNEAPEQVDEAPEQVAEAAGTTPVEIVESDPAPDETPEDPAPVLEEAQVTEALGKVTLPDISRARLLEGQYASIQELEEAIRNEADYVAALTGAGQPMGMHRAPASAFNLKEALDAIDQRYHLNK